jgi:hypothetical protein
MAPDYATSVEMEKQYWEPIEQICYPSSTYFIKCLETTILNFLSSEMLVRASEDVVRYGNSIDNNHLMSKTVRTGGIEQRHF